VPPKIEKAWRGASRNCQQRNKTLLDVVFIREINYTTLLSNIVANGTHVLSTHISTKRS